MQMDTRLPFFSGRRARAKAGRLPFLCWAELASINFPPRSWKCDQAVFLGNTACKNATDWRPCGTPGGKPGSWGSAGPGSAGPPETPALEPLERAGI